MPCKDCDGVVPELCAVLPHARSLALPHRRPRLCWAIQWAIGRKPFKEFEEDKVTVLSQRWKWVRRPKGSAGSESCGQFMGLRHRSLLHCACCAYALRCATCPSVYGNTDEHRLELLAALLRRSLLVLCTRQHEDAWRARVQKRSSPIGISRPRIHVRCAGACVGKSPARKGPPRCYSNCRVQACSDLTFSCAEARLPNPCPMLLCI